MSTPTQSQAYSAALASYTAMINAATAKWKADATILINNATTLGKFNLTVFTIPNMSINDAVSYFTSLGYTVTVPAYATGNPDLSGFSFVDLALTMGISDPIKSIPIYISWGLPPTL